MASLLPRIVSRRPLLPSPSSAVHVSSHWSLVRPRVAAVSRWSLPNACGRAAAASFSTATSTASSSTAPTLRSLRPIRPLRTLPRLSQQSSRRSYSTPPPKPPSNNIKFWPFFLIIAMGSGGYIMLANTRHNMAAESHGHTDPTFSSDDVSVVFVLGGPGAGKGTQCGRLVDKYGFVHLSAGDLLRAEQSRPGSQFGQLIQDCIRDGAIVPMEVTVKLLENAMKDNIEAHPGEKHRFLIDGFPRKKDQAIAFEAAVCRAQLVLFYDCPEAEMERRLLDRGKTSGRVDDNAESIRKRFRTFIETSMPVVDEFAREGRVVKIDSTPTPDAVFAETTKQLGKRLSL